MKRSASVFSSWSRLSAKPPDLSVLGMNPSIPGAVSDSGSGSSLGSGSGFGESAGGAGFRLHGRRKTGKLSARQQKLLEDILPAISLSVERNGRIRPWPPFGTDALNRPLWMEIGFGKGEHLALQAGTHPDVGFIGAEPFVNGIVALLSEIDKRGLENIRIYPDDARTLIGALPDASLERIFLLHPDPWPKSRHAKRRFINPENLASLARVMADGAELRLQTDHMGYARWALIHLTASSYFQWTAESIADWRDRPDGWPETRYEAKARKDGRSSVYLRFERLPR